MRRWLDHGVGAGEDEGLVPVGVPHEVGRLAVGASHLQDLAEMVLLANGAPVYMQLVTDCCVHPVASGASSQNTQTGPAASRREGVTGQ
jgi:hypothetical protein